nr:hypothetical protein [Bacteroidota bacterium]MBK9653635.1 hypothetical protein [Bacteroidota bacterium]MBK9653637.1 hypothetical protein [Bacteroidota bacterium]
MASTFVDDIDKCVTKQALHKAMSKEFLSYSLIKFSTSYFKQNLELQIANSNLNSGES